MEQRDKYIYAKVHFILTNFFFISISTKTHMAKASKNLKKKKDRIVHSENTDGRVQEIMGKICHSHAHN